ncbi:amidohydrolase [Herbaspirillum sp. RTI4]|uniref:amidohydrolase n=1 Tax=Herbaspirillum sp. RTI4 TaxID=3048640 RepID=UPI002AB4F4D6|nr:amidohydrolase [Herbaspirillum sp. RTI4]MDY7579954.1 amidohydrolase [Herbaspirillum sp. RTI4]MEA9982902.1 amidohydrolase [Herbaspirillum sp. RTI4]
MNSHLTHKLAQLPFSLACLFLTTSVLAQTSHASVEAAIPTALIARVNKAVDADTARLTAIFKDLHQHPEIGFTETRTAAIVAKDLRSLGFSVTEKIGQTGVVGVFKNGPGPTVWFRADMDANSVREATGLPYAATAKQHLADGSEIDVMHACGHDAHVTWLLGLAKTMVALSSDWSGTLVVYAQPAEEVGLGAQAMVDDNLWQRGFPQPDYAFGSHTAPGPLGYLSSSPGVRMAGVDQLDITFKGIGGHGSSPQATIDPVVMAAQAVLAYQTIVSRNLDPQAAAVVTVGAIVAGRDNNVIPESAVLKLNLRWFTKEVREQMLKRIDDINNGVAIAAGVSADKMPTRVMKGNAGPLVNNKALVEKINISLEALMGKGKVIDQFPAVMGSEDFQEVFRSLNTPYVLMMIGVAPLDLFTKARAAGKEAPYSNHNSDFFVDLAAIPIGAKVNAVAALSILAKRR